MKKVLTKYYIHTSTYSKVMTLITIVSIGFLILFVALFYYGTKQNEQFKNEVQNQYKNEINSLIKLNSQKYSTLIDEITFWDELVNFIEKKDIQWFDNSLSYLVDTNQIDYIDSYNLQEEFVCKVSSSTIKSYNFIPKKIFKELTNKKSIRFFVKVPEGVIEVYGATVHPSEDPFKNKTTPKGYLFMGKLLDNNYFAKLKGILNSEVEFLENENSKNDDYIYYAYKVNSVNDNSVTYFQFKRPLTIDFNTTKRLLFFLLFGFISTVFIYAYYAKKWAKTPLKLIQKVLKTGEDQYIHSLKNIRGEFRYIGNLFEENKHKEKQLEDSKIKAEESDNLKSAFLMNLSHEIRTPMNAVMGFSELLSNPALTREEIKEYASIIQNNSKNLIDIIDDLVELSKIESKQIKTNLISIDLKELVTNLFSTISIVNQERKNIDFKLIHPENELKTNIITDAVKLRQIITNLVNNAFKFTEQGFIIISYSIDRKSNKINFTVKDSGIGISDKDKDKIFNRFIKLNSNLIIKDGLGLGLAISKHYVEMLGGTIDLKSEQGVGTMFYFNINLEIEKNTVKPKIEDITNDASNQIGNQETILVAEDDLINFKLIEKHISSKNFKVIHAKNGEEAVELAKSNTSISLIFMDIKMPILDGYQAFIKIREFNKNVPIIAHTSYSFIEEVNKIKELGFNDYISKPIEKEKVYLLLIKHAIKKE